MDFVANFSLNKNDLEANFELNQPVQFDALFEINPAGASWGGITGTLSNQTDLQNALDLKADKTELDADVELLNQTITEAYNTLDNKIDDVNSDLSEDISTLNTAIQNEATTRAENDSLLRGDINTLNTNLTAEISNRETADSNLQTQINSVKQTADSALQPNDNITLLNNNAGYITNADLPTLEDLTTQAQLDAINSGATSSKIGQIATNTSNINSLSDTVTNNYNTLDGRITSEVSALNTAIGAETTNRQNADNALQSQIDTINSKIPSQASSTNKLADKDFVNSSIATNTANFIGTFNSVAELEAYSGTLTNNDYAFVTGTDQAGNTYYDRYKWNGSEWLFEYELNNSSFTAEQWASINSGITSGDVALIATALQPSDLNGYATETYVNTGLATKQNVLTAGNNITISGDTISATDTDTTYTAGTDIEIVNTPSTSATVSGTDSIALNNAEANTLQSVTVSGVTEQKSLLTDYQRVQYLESTDAGQYIDLGDALSTATDDIEVQLQLTTLSNTISLVGARNSTTDKNYNIGAYGTSSLWRWGWKGNSNAVPDVAIDTNKHTFYIDHTNQTFSIDGVVVETREISGNITTPTTPILFGIHATSATLLYLSPVRIYKFKKWRSGELVQHLIPCRRKSDNELGMYDLVTGDFLTNAGDGDFVAGADIVNPSPDNIMPIWCNNGMLKVNSQDEVYTDGTTETITDSLSNTVTAEMLLSIGNYTDTQEILTGAVTRNTAIKVLKGTESWYVNTGDYNFYRLNSAVNYSGNLSANFYCTHFRPASVASTTNNQGIRLNGNAIFLRWDELYPATTENLPLFKQWLADQYQAGVPVILVYPITTATTETVTGQTLNVQNGDNTLTATGALTNLPISAIYTTKEINTINFTNDTGYITEIDSTDVVDALGYTPVSDTAMETALSGKQDTLVSGTNIKTVNSNSILGSGNLSVGTVTSVNNTQPDASGNVDLDVTTIPPIAYATSTTPASTVQKEVSIPEITELNVGQIIVVQPTITSTVANSTLKLNDFDAYPMRYSNSAITTSTDSTVWSLNYPSQFVFDGTYWVFLGHGTDTNTTYTINYSIDAGAYKAGVGNYAITRYSLCMQKPDMSWEKVTATSATYSTGTSKSVNTNGFILGNIRYYNTTAIVANGANTASNTMYEKAATLDFRYSTNCGTTPAFNTGDYIYFVGTIGVDGLFYLDTTTWWTNTLPSTNDGKLYVQLGKFLADYNISLYENHPAYYYDGNKLCEYKVADNKQDTISDLATIRAGATLGATAVQPSDLATVATSGSYNDLSDKPTIPSEVTESTVSGWGFTKNVGTVTSVNNTQPVNGNVTISIPDTSTLANKDLSNLSSTGEAKFQAPLVSGTNIKTINNTSLLGSGNIDTSEVFIAEYGVTSFADIETAYNAGKVVFCKYNNFLYVLQQFMAVNEAIFTAINSNSSSIIHCNYSTSVGINGWFAQYNTLQSTTSKVTSLSSSSTDTQYPSAKCVYDELTDKADTDLSNLSSTGQAVIDGAFVSSAIVLSSVKATGSYTIDLQSYLPADGANYEVWLTASNYTSSNTYTRYKLYTDIMNAQLPANSHGANYPWLTHTGTNSREGCFLIKVPVQRYIYEIIEGTAFNDRYVPLTAIGYRRLGTNS